MRPTRQIPFDLPVRPALGRDDFVITPVNATAVAMIEADAGWPNGELALSGPEASGKTHLSHVWAAQADAVVVAANALDQIDIPTLVAARHVVVEDVPEIGGDRTLEAALFHLHNLVLAEGGKLMLTGRGTPGMWGLRLADLASRVNAATMVALDLPDDALLAALLDKHFRDRQLDVPEAVITYLLPRMARSGVAARALARKIDSLSLAHQHPVTIPLARDALAAMSQTCDTDAAET